MKSIHKIRIIIPIILLIIFFLVLNLTGFSEGTRNFFYSISAPIQRIFWQAGDNVSDFFSGFFNAQELKKEKDEIFLRNLELIGQISALQELEKENKDLREALNLGLEKDFQLVLSQVINKDITQDSLLVNKGSEDGLSPGLPVITSQKTLLGQIGKVYKDFSEVVLITNKESSFDAKITGKDIYGVVQGKGNLEVSFNLLPKEEAIAAGETVVTSVLGGIFPPKLLVGMIKEIKKTDIEPFQTAELTLSFDLGELDNLFIITNF